MADLQATLDQKQDLISALQVTKRDPDATAAQVQRAKSLSPPNVWAGLFA